VLENPTGYRYVVIYQKSEARFEVYGVRRWSTDCPLAKALRDWRNQALRIIGNRWQPEYREVFGDE
jgi:hypothetical protein